ncbi:MAG: hypothetical protein KME14_13420 [Tildeniella torsiva UHER 1998/13D]|nr:hypothetical protein [Tildeniella torsiva UHER 1998/13D]
MFGSAGYATLSLKDGLQGERCDRTPHLEYSQSLLEFTLCLSQNTLAI